MLKPEFMSESCGVTCGCEPIVGQIQESTHYVNFAAGTPLVQASAGFFSPNMCIQCDGSVVSWMARTLLAMKGSRLAGDCLL